MKIPENSQKMTIHFTKCIRLTINPAIAITGKIYVHLLTKTHQMHENIKKIFKSPIGQMAYTSIVKMAVFDQKLT